MRAILRRAAWVLASVVALVILAVATRLALNFTRAEARGAEPLRELAARGASPARDAARAGLALVDTVTGFGHPEWVAVVDQRSHGDTLVLGLFRANDATALRRMVMPHPYISGVVRYDSTHRRLVYAGVGID
jgi:hypothetical protein